MAEKRYMLTRRFVVALRQMLKWFEGGHGPLALPRRQPQRPPIKWGKLTEDWASIAPNDLRVNLCDQAEVVSDTSIVFTIHLVSPLDVAPVGVKLVTGDVVAFIPYHDMSTGQMSGVMVGSVSRGEHPFAKASQNWSAEADSGNLYGLCRVKAHPLALGPGSTEDTDTDLTIYLPTPIDSNSIPFRGQPNIIDDEEFSYHIGADGLYYADPPYLDGIIDKTIREFHHITPPAGWELCDGDGGRPEHGGYVVAGYDAGDADYDAVGDTSGNKTQTLTHTQHRHSYLACIQNDVGTDQNGVGFDDLYTGYTTDAAHADVDMRQLTTTEAKIIRIDNKAAW